jgi:hypothetical protein
MWVGGFGYFLFLGQIFYNNNINFFEKKRHHNTNQKKNVKVPYYDDIHSRFVVAFSG